MVCVMENAAPHGYICYNVSCKYPTFELSTKHYRMFLKLLLIKKGAHAPGHHDLHIRLSKWPLAMAHPSNWKLLEVQQGFCIFL